jgi:hypothetical protein
MVYHILADIVVVVHLCFVFFVVLGGLLVLHWRALMWVHIPAALWGVLIEFAGWTCPLTPLENTLRKLGGEMRYGGGFIEHYIVSLLYPEHLTRELQIILGFAVVIINMIIYWLVFSRSSGRR